MPELPDIAAYIDALESRILGHELKQVRLGTPFLLRTVTPPLSAAIGHQVVAIRRVGKRVAFCLDNDVWLIIHLMIAGRLHWSKPAAKLPGKRGLAAFDFDHGTLILTEAGSRHRASLHTAQGDKGLADMDPGGLEVLDCTEAEFAAALTAENHTLKRALTDPRTFSGIGNAYSDEILHRARLSPVTQTSRLGPAEISRLFSATREVLKMWIDKLKAEAGGDFPKGVTAFREDMAVHGRFEKPCPDCGTPIQRIRFADNETNYCPSCQTGGRLLADRSLSRLLKNDWPRTMEELEALRKK